MDFTFIISTILSPRLTSIVAAPPHVQQQMMITDTQEGLNNSNVLL